MHDQDEPKKEEVLDQDDTDLDGVSFEDEEITPSLIKKLREKLKTAISEKQSYLENWQRDKAEFVNLRKRDQEGRDLFLLFAKEKVLDELIPVVTSFELAFTDKERWESVSREWREGVTSIYSQLQNVLTKNGLKSIEPEVMEKFNPHIHEAVVNTKTDDLALDGSIAQVLQKGYLFNEKVLRPAQVAVYSMDS
jgi:molecular chaperone GrpE